MLEIYNYITSMLNLKLFSYADSAVTGWSIILAGIFIVVFWCLVSLFNKWFIRGVLKRSRFSKQVKREALLICRSGLLFMGFLLVLKILGVDQWLYDKFFVSYNYLKHIVDLKLFTIGKTEVTLWTAVYLLILVWLLVRLTGQLQVWLLTHVMRQTKIEQNMCEIIATVIRYVALTIGTVVILQSAGIDLSALTIMAGAMGIAIGLGLQSIINNLMSGLIILFERQIKIGDCIDIGGATGEVTHISLRSTTIITKDNVAIIVPNSDFTTSKVINWTYAGRKCHFKFPVRVAYGSTILRF